MRRRQPKVCIHCDETFVPSRIDALYCSTTCRTSAYKLRRYLEKNKDNPDKIRFFGMMPNQQKPS